MENLNGAIEITPGTVADIRDFNEIRKQCWLQIYPNQAAGITKEDILARDWDSPKRWQMWRKSVSGGWFSGGFLERSRYWAARTRDGRAIGFVLAIKRWGYGYIDKMYVHPEYQGKGIGTRLLKAARDWLPRHQDVELDVVVYNTNAIRFYEKMGFEKTEKPGHETILPSGKKLSRIWMALRRR